MSVRPDLPPSISVDSGVILAYLLGERTGELVRSSILSPSAGDQRVTYFSGASLAELFYILCRRRGTGFAGETVDTVLETGYLIRVSSASLDTEAGRYKCERSIPLADCYVLATAKLVGATAVFARREEDIEGEMKKAAFDVKVLFLEDLVVED